MMHDFHLLLVVTAMPAWLCAAMLEMEHSREQRRWNFLTYRRPDQAAWLSQWQALEGQVQTAFLMLPMPLLIGMPMSVETAIWVFPMWIFLLVLFGVASFYVLRKVRHWDKIDLPVEQLSAHIDTMRRPQNLKIAALASINLIPGAAMLWRTVRTALAGQPDALDGPLIMLSIVAVSGLVFGVYFSSNRRLLQRALAQLPPELRGNYEKLRRVDPSRAAAVLTMLQTRRESSVANARLVLSREELLQPEVKAAS